MHGNGYYLTKHSVGVYSTRPPTTNPVPPTALQERIDGRASALPVDPSPQGPGEVVAYTAAYDRDGAPGAAVALVDLGGRRTVAARRRGAHLGPALAATASGRVWW